MKLLHIIHRYYPYIGGSEQVMQELSERLAGEGHDVSVYTTDAWDLEHFWMGGKRRIAMAAEEHNGVHIRRFPVRRLPASRLLYPALRRTMAGLGALPFDTRSLLLLLARYPPPVPALDRALDAWEGPLNLVHVANIAFDSLVYAGYRLARRRRVPLIITPYLHLGEPGGRRVRRMYTMPHQIELLRRADAVLVQTELEREALAEYGIPSSHMHCIGVGVNPERLAGGQATRFRTKYNIPGPFIMFLGAAAFDKGAMHLVEAMERVWQRGNLESAPDLVMAGPVMSDFASFLARRPPATRARVHVLGFISDQDKRDLLAAGDVLALPSRTESFGVVYLEAWTYNKPVIGACAGGVPAVISDGTDGLLVPFGDTEALAARIVQLEQDRALAERLGRAGHARVMQELTWDRKYAQVRQLYEQLAR